MRGFSVISPVTCLRGTLLMARSPHQLQSWALLFPGGSASSKTGAQHRAHPCKGRQRHPPSPQPGSHICQCKFDTDSSKLQP